MKPGHWVQIAALSVVGLCMVGSTLLVKPINDRRQDLQIVQTSRYGDAPEYALLAASMGTFRGLAADYLWYRAEKLKNEGKLFEANTTAEWITTLQPRFGQVWVFQSWNMAYNISVITHTPEERWDWVNKGIKLLRDEGIVYNPHNIAIYRQLGWTFFHKIGQRADDMNVYYKCKLAMEWQELLGNPTEGATQELALKRFKPIADAAETYFAQAPVDGELREPLSHLYENEPQVRELVERLRQIGYEPGLECLRTIGTIQMYGRYSDPRTLAGPGGPLLDDRGRKLYDLLGEKKYGNDYWLPLISFMQAKVLIEDYHMEPKRMYDLMERFGPMDWRHPASHAIYWAATGIEKAGELRDKTKIDVLNTDRQIIHGLQMLMHQGIITFNPTTMRIDTTPDPRFIDAYGDAMLEANKRQKNIEWTGHGNEKSFEQGHENFLLRAVLYSYLYGDTEKAQKYYKQLRDLYGQKPNNVSSGRYTLPLQDLVITEIRDEWTMVDQVGRQLIESMMINGFRLGLARADYNTFQKYIELARALEKQIVKDRGYDNPTAPGGQGRLINWESFDQLLGETYIKYLRTPGYDLYERAQVYNNSPSTYREIAYPLIYPAVVEQAKAIGYEGVIDRWFPAPPEPEGGSARDQAPASPQPSDSEPTGRDTLERK